MNFPNKFRKFCTCGEWYLTESFLLMHINYMKDKGIKGHERKI